MATTVKPENSLISENITRPGRLERFDILLASVIGLLLIAIAAIILVGDQAGVGISLLDLNNTAVSGSRLMLPAGRSIQLHFSEPMALGSVRVRFVPDIPHTLRWTGSTLVVAPLPALTPGQNYTLSLDSGIRALSGRLVTQTLDWQISVEPLRMVFLAPAIPTPQDNTVNLWIISADGHGEPVALTHSAYGIDDFAVSPDGRQIAFSQRDGQGKTDLFRVALLKPRYVGFMPFALLLALILATPVSLKRKGWALLIGIVLIHLFLYVKLSCSSIRTDQNIVLPYWHPLRVTLWYAAYLPAQGLWQDKAHYNL